MKKPLPDRRNRVVALSTLTVAQRRAVLALIAAQEAAERRDAQAAKGAA